MPHCDGYRYCLTMIDRFSRWPEAVPLVNQEATTVAEAFFNHWIARFGVPLRVTTDQGRQFESNLFKHLNRLTGTTHIRTTAYHPASNGMVERFHRQLKAAIRCHQSRWTEALPAVLLGIRSAWKDDINATTAEMLYGQPLRLPGELLTPRIREEDDINAETFVKQLRQRLQDIRPAVINRHGDKKIFIFKDLATTGQVFVRHDGPKRPLQHPYDGPYRVVSRSDKFFIVNVKGKNITISIDRLKPAYTILDNIEQPEQEPEQLGGYVITTAPLKPDPQPEPPAALIAPDVPPARVSAGSGNTTTRIHRQTRSGRQVRFPDRFQSGLS